MWRLRAYRTEISRIITTLGSFASLFGAASTALPSPIEWTPLLVFLLSLSLLLLIATLYLAFKADSSRRYYRLDDDKSIRNYMLGWIENGSRVAIWSRDMSWVKDDEMRELLRRKAAAKELIICLPRETQLSQELATHGAEIHVHRAMEAPGSRFTIANFHQGGSRVAVGRRQGNFHVIEEFSADDHPAFHMSNDLIMLARQRSYHE